MQYMYNVYCWTCVYNIVYYLKQEYMSTEAEDIHRWMEEKLQDA